MTSQNNQSNQFGVESFPCLIFFVTRAEIGDVDVTDPTACQIVGDVYGLPEMEYPGLIKVRCTVNLRIPVMIICLILTKTKLK